MLFWISHFFFSYIASLFFCIIFDAPKRMYFYAGFVGACGWTVYIILYSGLHIHTIYASFFSSLTLGLISHIMARLKKEPVIIFMIPGIIPLVPEGLAFDTTKSLIILQFSKAVPTMLEVTLIAGAIAMGLLFADQIARLVITSKSKLTPKTKH